jgi:hypothetical protein
MMLLIMQSAPTFSLLKARIVEPEKQSLQSNGSVTRNTGVTVGTGVFYVVRAEAIIAT